MSVLIRGMQMPESCLECMNSGFRTAVKCAEWTEISAGRRENERAWSCPLVELPERNGRLIDADKLMRDINKYHLSDGKFQHWVEVQPTVIEAEGEL